MTEVLQERQKKVGSKKSKIFPTQKKYGPLGIYCISLDIVKYA